jgi:uncharacterized protein
MQRGVLMRLGAPLVSRSSGERMGILQAMLLVVVGVGGGTITALIGGASLVTFPALVAIGLSPVGAVVVNLVALIPANLAAAWWDRTELPEWDSSFAALLAVALVGSVVGAALLLATPEALFGAVVPLLLAAATALFAFSGRVAKWLERRAVDRKLAPRSRWRGAMAAMIPVSIYIGYFGAGASIMLLGILSVGAGGDYRTANAVKNLISGLTCITAAVLFILQDAVAWLPVALVMAGGLAGAALGVRIAQVASREAMRIAVIATSALLTVVFAWRYWF